MNAEITFSGPIALIKLLCQYAQELDDEFSDAEGLDVDKLNLKLGEQQSTEQKLQNYATGGVPPTSTPVKKPTETKAQKAARLKAEAEAQAAAQPAPVEPNAAANMAIQQQHQWAQQAAPQPTFGGFPSAPAAPAQPAAFPASAPAQPVVDTAAQAWLAPQAVNAAPGPRLEDVYQLLSSGVVNDNAKRTLFSQWLAHKGIQDISVIKDQPEAIMEAYGIVQKIISGEIHA